VSAGGPRIAGAAGVGASGDARAPGSATSRGAGSAGAAAPGHAGESRAAEAPGAGASGAAPGRAQLELSAAQQQALAAQFPYALTRFPTSVGRALEFLAAEEAWRRGGRDAVSGAWHRLGLTQGTLLKEEFDVAMHSGDGGWRVGAVIVDLFRMTLFNAAHGFVEGDRALRACADALGRAFAGAKVVRIHGDAFAALLGPMADARLGPDSEQVARAALTAATLEWKPALGFTVALLDLTLVSPSHHEVIGPLVWAECERALMTRQRVATTDLQVRRVVLDALVPDPR